MENHFDTKIVLSTESQYDSLYKWILRETGDAQNKHQRDQIPWPWSLRFSLEDIQLVRSFQIGDHWSENIEEAEQGISEEESIRASLTTNYGDDGNNHPQTRYSMLGTNREISKFSLYLRSVRENEKETCSAWGAVSYTTEHDFRDVTSNDEIIFSLLLSPERFGHCAELVREKSITSAYLRIGKVQGFYSDWSPAVSTSWVKVLTGDKDHAVDIPEGCDIAPPRLGKVGVFELYLHNQTKLHSSIHCNTNEENGDTVLDMADESSQFTSVEPPQMLFSDEGIVSALKSLRVASWITIGLLVMIALKFHF